MSADFGEFLRTLKLHRADGSPIADRWDPTENDDDPLPAADQMPFQARQSGNATARRSRPLSILTPAECAEAAPRGYLIKGMIAPGDLVLLFGQPGAGKSVIAPHLGYAVARGADVFSRRVKQGRTLYVAAEDPHGMRQRVHALMIEQGDAPDFLLVDGITDLLSGGSLDPDRLRELVAEHEPALVVIDTIAAAFPGLRENEAEDMGNVVRLARSLTDSGAAVVLVHHSPKADDSTPRGHGSLNGDADVGLRLTKDTEGVTGSFSKNRNGPSDALLGFTIKAVCIGTDEDGEPITAPALEEKDGNRRTKRLLTPLEQTGRTILADLIVSAGKPLPSGPGFPSGMRGVAEEDWREECESRRLSTAENEFDRARSFRRVYAQLLQKKQIAARDGIVWLSSPEAEMLAG